MRDNSPWFVVCSTNRSSCDERDQWAANRLFEVPTMNAPPEHNVTGVDYTQRSHLTYSGPIIDIHAHVMVTRPGDPATGPPTGQGPGASIEQAGVMLGIAENFGIVQTV